MGENPASALECRVQRLVGQAHAGDGGALEELHRAVTPTVYSWAHLRMGPSLRGRIDPEEIVQETWLRALGKLGEFDASSASFRAWILTIARYVLIEATRSLKRGVAANSTFFGRQPDPQTGMVTRIARDDALRSFLERVGGLDEQDRELVVLRGLEGRPFDEIGSRIGVSAGTAGKRWERLRGRLVAAAAPKFLL